MQPETYESRLHMLDGTGSRICEKSEELERLESQPWELDDVPLDAWFRMKTDISWLKIVEVNLPVTFRLGRDRWSTLQKLHADWEWSLTPLDKESWKSCSKRWTKDTVK